MAAIYVHVPFCRQRCSYCDFYFVTSHRRVDEYVDAVCTEIRLRAESVTPREPVLTVYFGGGTPSRLGVEQMGRILDAFRARLDLSELREVTVEANPDDVDQDYLDGLLEIGVNRMSIGLQSLNSTDLEFMFRSHSEDQGRAAIETALRSGFESVSLDLIFGLPEMSNPQWGQNLTYAVSSGVQHVSLYGLTIEPGTVLGKRVRSGKVVPAPERRIEEQFRMAHEVMTGHGFEHYEVSNFARVGFRSRHNQSYWDHSNYLGIGPAAHSLWKSGRPRRWENVRSLSRYLATLKSGALPTAEEEDINPDRLMREYVLLGLRTSDGIDLEILKTTYGYRMSEKGEEIVSSLVDSGKLVWKGSCLGPTLEGYLVADSLTSLLLNGDAFVASRAD